MFLAGAYVLPSSTVNTGAATHGLWWLRARARPARAMSTGNVVQNSERRLLTSGTRGSASPAGHGDWME